jgi:hypothetical protein
VAAATARLPLKLVPAIVPAHLSSPPTHRSLQVLGCTDVIPGSKSYYRR